MQLRDDRTDRRELASSLISRATYPPWKEREISRAVEILSSFVFSFLLTRTNFATIMYDAASETALKWPRSKAGVSFAADERARFNSELCKDQSRSRVYALARNTWVVNFSSALE